MQSWRTLLLDLLWYLLSGPFSDYPLGLHSVSCRISCRTCSRVRSRITCRICSRPAVGSAAPSAVGSNVGLPVGSAVCQLSELLSDLLSGPQPDYLSGLLSVCCRTAAVGLVLSVCLLAVACRLVVDQMLAVSLSQSHCHFVLSLSLDDIFRKDRFDTKLLS